MPSALASRRSPARHDDLDSYDVHDFDDDDDDDNPFDYSPPPNKKRKEADEGLGINKEVTIKKARVPNVKLDEARLLGPAGIPKLMKRAVGLKFKGKGHEFSDASRLLAFYQLWLDDLFPKARFLDALSMVEKAGHKKQLMTARTGWINEGRRPKPAAAEPSPSSNQQPAPATTAEQPKTPPPPDRDVPDDADLYDATPRALTRTTTTATTNRRPPRDDAPDDDDLEALMAEAEGIDDRRSSHKPPPPNTDPDDDDDDDLGALMAEAEEQDLRQNSAPRHQQLEKAASDGGAMTKENVNNFADEEAAMQEMEGLW